jgi:hypothetical protein
MEYTNNPDGRTSTVAELFEHAKRLGLNIVVPDDYTLTVDLDDEAAITKFDKNFKIVSKARDLEVIKTTVSKSGEGRHVYLKSSTKLDCSERILLQAILGSDSSREAHNFVMAERGDPVCSVLFEVAV